MPLQSQLKNVPGQSPPTIPTDAAVVPVDIVVRAATRCVVVTGPNTGGKTAALKALGLAALLANAGCGVPAAPPAQLPHFSAVLADIGDEQSLAASLSTFSGHLARIGAALDAADGRCLVLLDEVGTGTDPVGARRAGCASGAECVLALSAEPACGHCDAGGCAAAACQGPR